MKKYLQDRIAIILIITFMTVGAFLLILLITSVGLLILPIIEAWLAYIAELGRSLVSK